MFPVFIAKTNGFFFIVAGVTALLGAFAQINPIWQFGPYVADHISYAVQPDWYMGWLDGMLRVFPAWETVVFGHTIPWEVTIPSVIFPGIIFNICYVWPALERRYTKDYALHNLLDRPRDRPKRTAAGVAMLALLGMTFIASATDVIAHFLNLPLNEVLVAMRVLIIASPFVAYPIAYIICKELQGVANAGKRKTANLVTRTAEGEYISESAPLYEDDMHHELEAVPVPTFVVEPELPESPGGVRTVSR